MSVAAKKYVRKHVTGLIASRKAVLVELAWAADDHGCGARLSTAQIVDATELGRSTVKRALAELEAAQLIRRHVGGREHCSACQQARRGSHVFDVVIPDLDEVAQDPNQLSLMDQVQTVDQVHGGPTTRSTMDQQEEVKDVLSSLDQVKPTERLEEQRPIDADELPRVAHESAPARGADQPKAKPVTYRGRTVPRVVVAIAEQLLGAFNVATGSKLAARGRQGQATAALKQIVGALQERPDETVEVWERGVRAMIAEPPAWIEERFTIGHLFGPRAAEHTLARGRQQADTNGGEAWAPFAAPRRPGAGPDWGAIAEKLREQEGVAA